MNEPAFPRNDSAPGHNGMNLRDYFAAKAMQSYMLIVMKQYPSDINKGNVSVHSPGDSDVAYQAYAIADAMLAERSRT